MNEGVPPFMEGGEHSLKAEFVGGPCDGVQGFVGVGRERVLQVIRGVVHVYEFDPVTTEEGLWVYRYKGAEAWVSEAGRREEVPSDQSSVIREQPKAPDCPSGMSSAVRVEEDGKGGGA